MIKKLKLLLVISILSVPVVVMAQDPEDPPPVIDVPFDGGVSLLVAAGVAYGLKKVRETKKAEKL